MALFRRASRSAVTLISSLSTPIEYFFFFLDTKCERQFPCSFAECACMFIFNMIHHWRYYFIAIIAISLSTCNLWKLLREIMVWREKRWTAFKFLTFYDIWISFNCRESCISVLITVSHYSSFAGRTCCILRSLNQSIFSKSNAFFFPRDVMEVSFRYLYLLYYYIHVRFGLLLAKTLSTSRPLAWLSSILESRESQVFRAYVLPSVQFQWRNDFYFRQSLFHDLYTENKILQNFAEHVIYFTAIFIYL